MRWKDFVYILVVLSTATTTAQDDSSSTEIDLPNNNNNVSDLEDDIFPPDLFTMEQECKIFSTILNTKTFIFILQTEKN